MFNGHKIIVSNMFVSNGAPSQSNCGELLASVPRWPDPPGHPGSHHDDEK